MTATKILAVTSEIYPLVKTGGLADVAGALPLALRRHGVETVTLVPGYPAVTRTIDRLDHVWVMPYDQIDVGRCQQLDKLFKPISNMLLQAQFAKKRF